MEHQRAQQALHANLQLQSIQEREQLLRGSTGLNQTDLHLIHQQNRLHEESLRRAAAEQRNQALISGIPGVGQSQMENAIRPVFNHFFVKVWPIEADIGHFHYNLGKPDIWILPLKFSVS